MGFSKKNIRRLISMAVVAIHRVFEAIKNAADFSQPASR
jgi:hypothetical protein